MICGERAILAAGGIEPIDLDCARCGSLPVEPRLVRVSPTTTGCFDRTRLSGKAQAPLPSRRHGGRYPISETWLHHWRLVTLRGVDPGVEQRQADAAMARLRTSWRDRDAQPH